MNFTYYAVDISASNEGYPKFRYHGEGPYYKGLLLVESCLVILVWTFVSSSRPGCR